MAMLITLLTYASYNVSDYSVVEGVNTAEIERSDILEKLIENIEESRTASYFYE